MSRKPQPGDWVRFQRDGRLVIGIVAYVRESPYGHYSWSLITDLGTIRDIDVVETRRARQ